MLSKGLWGQPAHAMLKNGRSIVSSADDSMADSVSRRRVLRGALGLLGAGIATSLTPQVLAAPSLVKGLGDFSRLKLSNLRTGENLDIVYQIDGIYVTEALDELNWILRDWRQDAIIQMDTRTLDIVAKTYRLLDIPDALQIVSGYRSPETNTMLRKRGQGVAKDSYHLKGMAIDVSLPGNSVHNLHHAAMSVEGGGVGKYSRSGFVHMDCGPVRSWGA